MIDNLIDSDREINANADSSSMRRWVRGYFALLPTNEMGEELLRPLLEVTKRAFATTFIDDYDITESGIGLEALARFPRESVDLCLGALVAHSQNCFIPIYIERFKQAFYETQPKS